MRDKGVLSLSQGAYLLLGLPQVGFSDVDGEMCLGFFGVSPCFSSLQQWQGKIFDTKNLVLCVGLGGMRAIRQSGVCPGVNISPAGAKADLGASGWTSGPV